MFEDFKEKIREHNIKNDESKEQLSLSPEVLEKLKERGIDPDNVTLQQLFPESLDVEGNDLSLMSGAETEVMVTYAKIRKCLLERYPQTQEEAKMLGEAWDEGLDEPCQIDISKAREDPLSKDFITALNQLKDIYDKVKVFQQKASDYEKLCLRFYWHLTYNWKHSQNPQSFSEILLDSDIFEVVESYFNICRKYHVPTFEEPYYFLPEKRRLEIKLEGDMLRRSTDYCEDEIRISILEAFE